MVGIVLVCSSMLVTSGVEDDAAFSRSETLRAYEAARAEAGRDPDAHVALALWCEAHGLKAERARHLAMAVLTDPQHGVARALLGLVEDQGRWRRPEEVAERVQADAALSAKLDDYNSRRVNTPDTADAHWKLALWCEESGLEAQARAHLAMVVRLDPAREAAWKRLGYKKVQDRWVTDEQLARSREMARLQEAGDRRWRPLLETWKSWLGREEKRDEAERLLSGVDDPWAVRSVMAVFAAGSEADQLRAVQVLGQIDAPAASLAIAHLAVVSPSAEVRRGATETLRQRDPREFAGPLVALVRKPLKYEVRPVGGPGSPGALFVEGEEFNLRRVYEVAGRPITVGLDWMLRSGEVLVWGSDGLPYGVMLDTEPPSHMPVMREIRRQIDANPADFAQVVQEVQQAGGVETLPEVRGLGGGAVAYIARNPLDSWNLMSGSWRPLQTDAELRNRERERRAMLNAQERLQYDIQWIEQYNTSAQQTNDRVIPVLQAISGQDLRDDRVGWEDWYNNVLGLRTYRSYEKPTFDQVIAFRPPYEVRTTTSCFGAGTMVWTREGRRPIETLQIGDLVLSQSPEDGTLSYQPVLMAHHNPPSETYRITLGDEVIVSSEFHRFWVARRGWVMARDLQVGTEIRSLGGLRAVTAIEPGEAQPVYNLDVAENRSFFVGSTGALVHDQTVPGTRITPFDAPPALAGAVAE